MSENLFTFEPVGFIESCFTQKFTTPRQSGLITHARAKLKMLPEFSHPDIVRGLEQYSHIWIIFVFHETQFQKGKNTVRPPRLGGNEKLGVFATRSNFRPNPIGQSVVKLDAINKESGQLVLNLSGVDILNNTPILDIKPYIPYADSLLDADGGMANTAPEKSFTVQFTEQAMSQLDEFKQTYGSDLKQLIIEILSFDVRPAYYEKTQQKSEFMSCLYDLELKWHVLGKQIEVTYMGKMINT